MTGAGDETQPAMTYPTKQQYEQWKEHADEMDMSISEFMASMIEAGRKKFEVTVEPDETNQELRKQRNDLKAELERSRERIETLENRLHNTERDEIKSFVEDNPGATYNEIIQHLGETVPERVDHHLDEIEGSSLRRENDCFHRMEADQ